MKLIYFVTEDWFFCSHFLDRAVAAKNAGYEVSVLTRVNKHAQIILDQGINLIPLVIDRSKINPFNEIKLIKKLVTLYRQERPQIVHQVALKPILYGSLAARIAGVPYIVNAPVGLGYVFSSKQLKARLLKPLILLAYRFLLNPINSIAIFENPDDRAFFANKGIIKLEHTRLIRGAGVNMQQFVPTKKPDGLPIVILASRMLWDKGVGEFVEAAKIINKNTINARFVLVGAPDTQNPESIGENQLIAWQNAGCIEWWGHQDDMPSVFSQAHIICLPSYAEGLPRVLIEAAASGLPIVTTNIPGCREIVHNAENGYLIPPKSIDSLVNTLNLLISNSGLRLEMGENGRNIAINGYSTEQVNRETLAIYEQLHA
ncbi:glycosyltransferase family 4 protein [Methylomonas sp. AM2-LC]|uniref:glycosyltransferase family 4 protein n=1 Tax=Methylomonas sp. AM2-LC TaxID=3153301 RepID=UPI003263C076